MHETAFQSPFSNAVKLSKSLLMGVHCVLVTGETQLKRTAVIYKQSKSFRNENRETDPTCISSTEYVYFYDVFKRNYFSSTCSEKGCLVSIMRLMITFQKTCLLNTHSMLSQYYEEVQY